MNSGAAEAGFEERPSPAHTFPDGTPHPDPLLASKGWQVQGGIYQRVQPAPEIEHEDYDLEAG